MSAMKRMSILALLVVLVVVCAAPVAVHAGNLYPACGGNEHSVQAHAGKTATVQNLAISSKAITMSCLAYEVTSIKGGSGNSADPCTVKHSTDYSYRVFIRATYKDLDTSKTVQSDYEVSDVAGGSIDDISIRLPAQAQYAIMFENLGENKKCVLSIRLIADVDTDTEAVTAYTSPVLVGAEPRNIFSDNLENTYFFVRYSASYPATDESTITLKSTEEQCWSDAKGRQLNIAEKTPSTMSTYPHQETLKVYDYHFVEPGTYRMCYRASRSETPVELGVVAVFSGNPVYYEITSGTDSQGRVQLYTQTTITFTGYNLDTRKQGDSAKFVDDEDTCEAGSPAGGVPAATDLGPADEYGPGTTTTTWTWRMTHAGAYKVCYRRRQGVWTEVPSLNSLGSSFINRYKKNGDIPIPTDPASKENCPIAPENTKQNPWVPYKSIKLTLSTPDIPQTFFDKMKATFCVPRAALSVTHSSTNAEGKRVVYLAFLCEDLSEGATLPCSSVERMNYAVYLNSTNPQTLRSAGIESCEGSTQLFAFGNDLPPSGGGAHLFSTFLICATVLGVCGIAAYALKKYKENKHYFVQFGLDDGDVDDMYDETTHDAADDFGDGAMNGVEVFGVSAKQARSSHAIKNATIELEV